MHWRQLVATFLYQRWKNSSSPLNDGEYVDPKALCSGMGANVAFGKSSVRRRHSSFWVWGPYAHPRLPRVASSHFQTSSCVFTKKFSQCRDSDMGANCSNCLQAKLTHQPRQACVASVFDKWHIELHRQTNHRNEHEEYKGWVRCKGGPWLSPCQGWKCWIGSLGVSCLRCYETPIQCSALWTTHCRLWNFSAMWSMLLPSRW